MGVEYMYLNALITASSTQKENQILKSENKKSNDMYQNLLQEHKRLTEQYTILNQQYLILKSDHESLKENSKEAYTDLRKKSQIMLQHFKSIHEDQKTLNDINKVVDKYKCNIEKAKNHVIKKHDDNVEEKSDDNVEEKSKVINLY